MHETVVFHDGGMWEGPDAVDRAFHGEEPDEWLAVDLEPDEPPRLVTTISPPILLEEMAVIMQHWSRRYPASVVRPTTAGWEIWTKPTPRAPRRRPSRRVRRRIARARRRTR